MLLMQGSEDDKSHCSERLFLPTVKNGFNYPLRCHLRHIQEASADRLDVNLLTVLGLELALDGEKGIVSGLGFIRGVVPTCTANVVVPTCTSAENSNAWS